MAVFIYLRIKICVFILIGIVPSLAMQEELGMMLGERVDLPAKGTTIEKILELINTEEEDTLKLEIALFKETGNKSIEEVVGGIVNFLQNQPQKKNSSSFIRKMLSYFTEIFDKNLYDLSHINQKTFTVKYAALAKKIFPYAVAKSGVTEQEEIGIRKFLSLYSATMDYFPKQQDIHSLIMLLALRFPDPEFSKFLSEDVISGLIRDPKYRKQLKKIWDQGSNFSLYPEEIGYLIAAHFLGEEVSSNLEYTIPLLVKSFEQFDPTIILSQGTSLNVEETTKNKGVPRVKIISNNEGYLDDPLPEGVIPGSRLTMSYDGKTISIGYNIFIPQETECKGIVVYVYGGNQSKDRVKGAHYPQQNEFINSLARQGYASIYLNLPDLLELKRHQRHMTKKLHDKIQEAIHAVYEVIKKTPERLLPEQTEELEFLKILPIYLYGVSFGGRIAILHAEMYPGTFNGYITHGGSLAEGIRHFVENPKRKRFNSPSVSRSIINEENVESPHLSPLLHIQNLKEPVLLHHNLNDNNVSAQVVLKFYEAARDQNKNVTLFITREGGGHRDLEIKGHGLPKNKAYDDYIAMMVNFMNKEVKDTPFSQMLSDWRLSRFQYALVRYHRDVDFKDRCLSYLLPVYYKNWKINREGGNQGNQENFEQRLNLEKRLYLKNQRHILGSWNTLYQPIVKALYRVENLMEESQKHQRLGLIKLDPTNQDNLWFALNQKLKWSDYVIEKAIQHFLPIIIRYTNEIKGISIPLTDELTQAVIPKLLNLVKEKIKEVLYDNTPYGIAQRRFYLEQIYFANPQLLKFYSERYPDIEDKVKSKFIMQATISQTQATQMYSQLVNEVQKNRIKKLRQQLDEKKRQRMKDMVRHIIQYKENRDKESQKNAPSITDEESSIIDSVDDDE